MISVCMATYNGEKYIYEQISSILIQLKKEDEIIVSDDGSSDLTLKILLDFNDERIKIFHNKSTHGFVHNFENALIQAKGNVIFLSDQDDVWLPGKVSKVLDCLKTYDLIVHDAELIDGNGCSLNRNYYSFLHSHCGFWKNLYKNRFLGCCMAFNKDVRDASLPLPSHIVAHDYWIGMLALTKFKVCFLSDILILYRRHKNNVSPSSEKSLNTIFYKLITKRFWILWNCLMWKMKSQFKKF